MISADLWNRSVRQFLRNRILGVTILEGATFVHPWRCMPVWQPALNLWSTTVNAGFVNASEVVARTPVEIAPALTLARTGQTTGTVSAWLSEGGVVMIRGWRKIGLDSSLDEPVPEYFRERGVANKPQVSVDLETLEARVIEEMVDPNRRLLRAADIVLRIPRPTADLAVDGDSVTLRYLVADGEPTVLSQPKYDPAAEAPVPPILSLLSGWADTPYHPVHLATVYLMSPPRAIEGSEPDDTWEPAVAHHSWWNLGHYAELPEPQISPDQIGLSPAAFLAGGAGGAIIVGLTNLINEQAFAEEAMLAGLTAIKSHVWTM
jgi:hypothetical protein